MTANAVNPAARFQLGRDASYVFGAQLLAITLGFVLNAVAAHALPTGEFAALSWSLTWLAWLVLCAQLGLMPAGTVLMAVEGEVGLAARLRPIVAALLVNSVVVGGVWWLLIGPTIAGASEGDADYLNMIGLVALWVPAAAIGPVIAGMLRGLHRFREAALYGEYVRRALLLVTLLVVVVGDLDRRLSLIVAVVVAIETGIAAAVVVALDRSARGHRSGAVDIDTSGPGLRRRALAFVLPTIDAPLLPQAGIWLLALVRPPAEVAILSIGIGISFIFGLPVFVGARVLGPRYARTHDQDGELQTLEPIARRHATVSVLFVVAAVAALVIFGDWAVGLVFGEQYADAATVAVILGVGGIVNAGTGSCAAALMHCGHERVVGITAALGAVAYLGLGLAMGNDWGANGVALAAAVVIGGRNLYLAAAARHRLQFITWVGVAGGQAGIDP